MARFIRDHWQVAMRRGDPDVLLQYFSMVKLLPMAALQKALKSGCQNGSLQVPVSSFMGINCHHDTDETCSLGDTSTYSRRTVPWKAAAHHSDVRGQDN